MHVLVTGAAGFIGSHTVERLAALGHRVTGLDSFESVPYPADDKRRNIRDLSALPRDRFTFVEGDLADPRALATAVTETVDVVCHLAALAGVRPSLAIPVRYLEVNVIGTGLLIERMRSLNIRRLVFASSSSVYGARPDETGAFRETDPCLAPASPYAATKRMNELQLSTYRDLYELGVHALRFFTVYGPRQRSDMAISKFFSALAQDRPLTVFGDGTSRRDYTFIADIVRGVVASIESVSPGDYEIFNLGGTATIALRDLISLMEQITGKRATLDQQPNQPGDVPITFADVSRARAALGYEPITRIAEGLAEHWEWLRADQSRST